MTASGAVKCWGNNNSGQIGDGSTLQRGTPVAVTGISSGAATVSTGANHSCSVSTSGAVKCWGANDLGQVGDGSHNQRLTPVPVVGLNSGIIKVDAGNFHSCARTTTGAPKCWGSNSDGQIGNGSVSLSFTSPVSVNNLASGIRDISGGEFHSCAIVSAGGVACWGRNDLRSSVTAATTTQMCPSLCRFLIRCQCRSAPAAHIPVLSVIARSSAGEPTTTASAAPGSRPAPS
ncbi:MAG: hypothetical protein IPH50_03440 [Rhodanobacteraceae bacterium]|nr:hypothetical protein [Rhodanobacteraceae bacterium]